jgi:hypothetical protein
MFALAILSGCVHRDFGFLGGCGDVSKGTRNARKGRLDVHVSDVDVRRSVDDRENNEKAQIVANAAQLQGFKDVGKGIQDSVDVSRQQFTTTMGGIQKNIDTVTGGKTFCYVSVSVIDDKFLFTVAAQGSTALHDVTIERVDMDAMKSFLATRQPLTWDLIRSWTKDYPPLLFLAATNGQFLDNIPIAKNANRNFHYNFFSMNGVWGETLAIRFVSGQWTYALKVLKDEGGKNEKILYTYIPKEFPKLNGKVDW